MGARNNLLETEQQLVSRFILGLRDDIKEVVKLHPVSYLVDAILKASNQELIRGDHLGIDSKHNADLQQNSQDSLPKDLLPANGPKKTIPKLQLGPKMITTSEIRIPTIGLPLGSASFVANKAIYLMNAPNGGLWRFKKKTPMKKLTYSRKVMMTLLFYNRMKAIISLVSFKKCFSLLRLTATLKDMPYSHSVYNQWKGLPSDY